MHEFKETACEMLNGPWDDACVASPFSACTAADLLLPSHSIAASRPSRPFEFPDGYNSYFGTVRMSVPEVLFNPNRFLPKEVSLSSNPLVLLLTSLHPSSLPSLSPPPPRRSPPIRTRACYPSPACLRTRSSRSTRISTRPSYPTSSLREARRLRRASRIA